MSQFKPSDSSVSKSQESTGPDTIQTVGRVKAKKNGKWKAKNEILNGWNWIRFIKLN